MTLCSSPGLSLSPRQEEVVKLVAAGHASKVIAAKLFISARTVETHRLKAMRKTGSCNVADLTRWALKNLEPDGCQGEWDWEI